MIIVYSLQSFHSQLLISIQMLPYPTIHYSDDENEVVLVIILSSIYYIQIDFQIFVQIKEDLWVNFLEPCLSISKI